MSLQQYTPFLGQHHPSICLTDHNRGHNRTTLSSNQTLSVNPGYSVNFAFPRVTSLLLDRFIQDPGLNLELSTWRQMPSHCYIFTAPFSLLFQDRIDYIEFFRPVGDYRSQLAGLALFDNLDSRNVKSFAFSLKGSFLQTDPSTELLFK